MWSYYVLVFSVIFSSSYCSEFNLDAEHCLLSSKNNSLIIDLTSAHFSEEVLNSNYTAYFSLCPKKLKKCPKNSFICLVDQAGKVVDLGSEIVGISYGDLYTIILRSAHGSGSVFIMCSHNGENSPVIENFSQSENSSLNFTYFIKWISRSSCPLRQYKASNSCTLYTKDQRYSLRSLQYSKDLYAVKGSDKYFINFCKKVSHENCGNSPVCLIRNGSSEGIAFLEGSTLQHIDSRGLTLTYRNIKGGNSIISFLCSLNTTQPLVQFIPEDEEDLMFNVVTSMICPPIKMNCLIHDKRGTTYDLSPLNLLTDNWQLNLKNGKKLIFNVCHPLNYIPHFLCAGGPYYACLVDSSNITLALGVDTKINVIRPGLISFEILGNTIDNKTFVLSMSLECSSHGTYPTLIKDSLNNMSIHWKTEAACPSEISQGKNCRLNNAYHLNEVDLSRLHKNNGDFIVKTEDESFRINICGNLNESCSQTNDASICYKNKNGRELAIGQIGGMEPMFKDGQILFNLEGEPCNMNATKSRITIVLSCEYIEDKKLNSEKGPEYFPSTKECEFYFIWKTNLVCSEGVSTECSLKENNKNFDLSPLKNLKENYVVTFNASTQIVLNVCHSVLPDHRIRCHITSGACLVNGNIDYILSDDYQLKKVQENLGLVSEKGHLEFINGEIHLTYTNGGICPFESEATQKTVIIFECNELHNDTHPFLVRSEQCEYIFKWSTRFACPIGRVQPTLNPLPYSENETDIGKECSINVMNKMYDLTALMGKDWYVDNKNLIIAICSPVKSPGCPIYSGACLMDEQTGFENIGNYNTNLKLDENFLYLYYNTSKSRQTKIVFICSKTDLQPKFIDERKTNEGLTTFISWPTSQVCDKKAEETCCHGIEKICEAFTDNYEVSVDSERSVFLSLCKPVIPAVGLLCPQNTASCMGTHLNKSFIDEKSLGSVFQQPIFNHDNSVRIEYLNGSLCKDEIEYSTSIRFFCAYSNKNVHPRFLERVDECRYEFEWGTNLLCNNETFCTLPFTNSSSNSSSHFRDVDHYFNGSSHQYIISFCKPSFECGSFICKSSNSKTWHPLVGQIMEMKGYDEGIVYYFMSADSMADHTTCGAEVDFHYSSSEIGPVLVKESDCFVRIRMEGKAFRSLISPHREEKIKPLSASSWYIVPIVLLIVTIILVLGMLYMKSRRQGFSQSVRHVFRYKRFTNSRVSEEQSSVELEFTDKENNEKQE